MKLLINASNLSVGGGVQVALSFINELRHISDKNEYYIFTSQVIDKQLDKNNFPSNFNFYLLEKSPSSLKTRFKVIYKLNKLEEQINPDIVFTIFGPSYWKPKNKHIMGFADGWVYNSESIAYLKLSFIKRIKTRLLSYYKAYYLKKDANYFIMETEDAKYKFSKIINLQLENIFVVGNTYSSVFDNKSYLDKNNPYYTKLSPKKEGEFRLLYIAHNYANKNLDIINYIIPLLNKNIRFVLTIDNKSYQKLFKNNTQHIINVGPVEQKSCPSLYEQCDALFAPTLLETFSASYPEAMKMKKPILTSNLSFAKDVCRDAALYFDPLNVDDIVKKIVVIYNDKNLYKELVEKGQRRLKSFETAKSRAEKYLEICEIINKGC